MLPFAEMMHDHFVNTYLVSSIDIERIDVSGSWTIAITLPANVQHERESFASDDPDQSRVTDRSGLRVYVDRGSDIRIGDRFIWDGEYWHIASVTSDRSVETYMRLNAQVERTATAPIMVAFRRRMPDRTWLDLGSFRVQQTIDQRDPLEQSRATIFDAASARGALVTGVLVGGSDLDAINVGDWFEIDEMPGRVTNVDRSNMERIELSYQREVRAV